MALNIKISTARSISSYYTQSLFHLLILKGEGLWQYIWELHPLLGWRLPLQGSQHYQHGLHRGHQRGLHTEGSLQTWHLLSLLLVLQDSLHHILEVAWCFERLVSVGIQSIQPLTNWGEEGNMDQPQVCCSWLMRLMPTSGFISQWKVRLTHALLQHSFSSHA